MAWLIPAGTECSIAKDDDARQYRRHVTTKDLRFERHRTFQTGAMTFEKQGWILLVKASKVLRAK